MFNLANLFTAANLISGCLAVVFALSGRLDLAPFAVFTGLIFDFLDGFAARLFKTSGEMGKQLDSLADMITFGVAPGVIMLYVLAVLGGDLSSGTTSAALHQSYLTWFSQLDVLSLTGNFVPFIALVLPFFSLFRLAKFNLDTRQSESFIGLPTPSMTLFFMSFPLVLTSDSQSIDLQYILFNPWVIVALMLMLGIMMISEVALFSLKLKQFGWHGNQLRIVFLLISLVFILLFKAWSFSLIVFLYLILSMIENTFLKKLGMKFKAEIDVMPLDALLDPQGKAVTGSMKNIGLESIDGVRIGRHIRLFVDADSLGSAEDMVDQACKKLLANQIMESYTFSVEPVN